jgi:hypothetical protein
MPFELTIAGQSGNGEREMDYRHRLALWSRADARLQRALRELGCVRELTRVGEPARIAAELKVAEARLHCLECQEAAEQLDDIFEGADLFC